MAFNHTFATVWLGALLVFGCGSKSDQGGCDDCTPSPEHLFTSPPEPWVPLSAISASTIAGQVCGLTQLDGRPVCWGNSRLVAPDVPGQLLLGVGETYGCSTDAAGSAMCWGTHLPPVPPDAPIKRFAFLGGEYNVALGTDGVPRSWGSRSGESAAKPVPGPGPYSDLHLWFGLQANGRVERWNTGEELLAAGDAKSVFGGDDMLCVLNDAGHAECIDATDPPQVLPEFANTDAEFVKLAIRNSDEGDAVCGLTADGSLSCWGTTTGLLRRFDRKSFELDVPEGTFVDFTLTLDFICGITTAGEMLCGGAPWWEMPYR